MLEYMSAKETAEKWNITQRRVSVLCSQNRIPDVAMLGNMWLIPRHAQKPTDARRKTKITISAESSHPFVKWAGGKGQLLPLLKDNLPNGMGTRITKYAEPFIGGGALLFALLNEYSFKEIYISDINKELINTFLVIKERPKELITLLNGIQTEYKALSSQEQQSYYYVKRDTFNSLCLNEETDLTKASLFIFLNRTCFNGLYRVNKEGKFNVPAGKYINPLICDSKNIQNVSKHLQGVSIISCDYRGVEAFAGDDTFVYFDPPYRPLNITSSFTSYDQTGFTDNDQIQLAALFKRLSIKGTKVMLSNSDPHNVDVNDNFFDNLYADFSIQRISATRKINSKADKRGNITELLIKNY